MVKIYRTEEEQLGALKEWWAENGRALTAGVVCSLLGVFGWQGWQKHRGEESLSASTAYLHMLEAEATGQPLEERRDKARQIVQNYSDTAYAGFAALHLARWAVQDGDLAGGAEQLQWVLDQGRQEQLIDIARLRLARVYMAQQRLDEAWQLLAVQDPGGFASFYNELRGDIHALRGDASAAREAWQQAAQEREGDDALLATKLENLGP